MENKGIIITILALGIVAVLASLFFVNFSSTDMPTQVSTTTQTTTETDTVPPDSPVAVTPISHASAVLMWDALTIYTDPVGEGGEYASMPDPDIILLTDIHGDHLSTSTLALVIASSTDVVAPQAVADLLSEEILDQTTVLSNGSSTSLQGFVIEAVPMYNLPESDDSRHVRGRGNGYVVEREGTRVYIAGDTSDTPEMRGLEDIDIAFVPMNPPFTMSVESAADAVLEFAPRTVYPYHYRGQDGLSDIERFRDLVAAGNQNINVVLLNWYPDNEE